MAGAGGGVNRGGDGPQPWTRVRVIIRGHHYGPAFREDTNGRLW